MEDINYPEGLENHPAAPYDDALDLPVIPDDELDSVEDAYLGDEDELL